MQLLLLAPLLSYALIVLHTKEISKTRREPRNDFQRDRDRVLYSSAFRRLAGVTQVVHAAEGHIFHNRLTHSLKVAQVARRIAENIISQEPGDLVQAVGIDPDVVETAALAHDLGHPPFGHIAEDELDQQLRNAKVSDGFEGNAQSFRIVTKVAIKSADHPGLDLSRASLNAILKYPWSRGTAGKESKKWGHYYTEKKEFSFARDLGPEGSQKSAEAEIMDWADDVTYSVHDVDDFYRAGLVPLDQLLMGTEERNRFIDAVVTRWEKDPQESDNKARLKVFDRASASEFFDDLRFWAEAEDLDFAFTGSRKQSARLSYLASFLIRRYALGPEDGTSTKAVSIDPSPHPRIRIQPQLRAEVDLLKALMNHYVFHSPALVTQQFGERRVIKDLFEVYFEAAQPKSKNKGLVPHPFREYLEDVRTHDDLERARLVADLIGSMTEQQTLLLHQRLTGLAPGSVRDVLV